MGCCTGNYLILQGDLTSQDIIPLMQETFKYISNFEGDIPGANEKDCGNYKFNDLPEARKAAKKFLQEILLKIGEENLKYPLD